MVRVAVFLPGLTNEWCLIDCVLDTGAGTTCVHPIDALGRLGLGAATLAEGMPGRRERHRGVGGGALYHVVPARYGLLDEHNEWLILEGMLRIAEMTPENRTLPSILGWDVLRRFAVALDWPQRLVELR